MVLIVIGILAVVLIIAGLLLKELKNADEKHEKMVDVLDDAFLKAEYWEDRFKTLQQMFEAERTKANTEIIKTKATVFALKTFLEEGVFYDKNNDTIVIVKELERIGEL